LQTLIPSLLRTMVYNIRFGKYLHKVTRIK
jgi:hypothetical protein